MWIEFGRIQLPPGHHPNDIEKEWGKLIVAMLEREKSLRPEVERYVKLLSILICCLIEYNEIKGLFCIFFSSSKSVLVSHNSILVDVCNEKI